MAGGRQLETPYGTIGAPNITADKETGIGAWSDDDFYKVMHDGITPSGELLYPVMPFDHFTKVSRADVLAIKAWLFSLPPVHAENPGDHLAFPFNIRAGLAAWRVLFFRPGEFKPDPTRSAQINRGAYLVDGLGHCGSCHTPRNIASASEKSKALGGGEIKGQGWFAPNITADVREGIGGWSEQDLVSYFKTGVAPGKAVAAGPMVEVVHDSLSHLTDDDLHDIALYLKAAPARALYAEKHPGAVGGVNDYLNHCAFCHQADGKGIAGAVPPLAGNGVVLAGGPEDVIRTVLGGHVATGSYSVMPGMAAELSSGQIANIVNYVRTSFGNAAPATATSAMVERLAKTTATMLSGTGPCDKVGPPPVASAIAASGVDATLRQVNRDNMVEQIGTIVPKVMAAGQGLGQADVVNGLTAAWCPVVMGDSSLPKEQRLELLQRFSSLVYTDIAQNQSGRAAASHASLPVPTKN